MTFCKVFLKNIGFEEDFLRNVELLALEQVRIAFQENKDVLKIIAEDFLPSFINTTIPFHDLDNYVAHYLKLFANCKVVQHFQILNTILGAHGIHPIRTRSRSEIETKLDSLKWIVEHVELWDNSNFLLGHNPHPYFFS